MGIAFAVNDIPHDRAIMGMLYATEKGIFFFQLYDGCMDWNGAFYVGHHLCRKQKQTDIPALEAQLKDVKNGINNLVKAMEAGVFTRSTKARLEELEAEEERLQVAIRDERVSHPKITENHIRCMFDKYRDMDMSIPANRERLIDRLVGSILLYDDGKIVITFYYKDEPFVGMLEEIASASDKVGSDTNALGSPYKTNPIIFSTHKVFGFFFIRRESVWKTVSKSIFTIYRF